MGRTGAASRLLLLPLAIVLVALLYIGSRVAAPVDMVAPAGSPYTQPTARATAAAGGEDAEQPPAREPAAASPSTEHSPVESDAKAPERERESPGTFTGWAKPDAEWIAEHALEFRGASDGHSLKLKPSARKALRSVRRPAKCPDRFVFVNTHTFGRHHNQLQEMLNIAVWARSLNRTAVLGWFRHNHRWTAMDSLYDFSRLARDYCVVTASEFGRRWGAMPRADRTAACVGQGVTDTPIKAHVRRCGMAQGVPAHYDSRLGVATTLTLLGIALSQPTVNDAAFVGLSGEIAFFMRPGLLEQAAASMRVFPHAEIVAEAEAFALKRGLRLAAGAGDDDDTGRAATGSGRRYFALHLRQREKECMKEMSHTWLDGGSAVASIDNATRRAIEGQCAVTTAQLDGLAGSLGLKLGGDGLGLFLASDHQNMALEKALVERGAIMYEGGKFHTRELGGLQGLGVDYYMLLRAERFTGNQLSSVSQNCCFHRLGRGRTCDGFVRDFSLFHSRVVDAGRFVPNVPW